MESVRLSLVSEGVEADSYAEFRPLLMEVLTEIANREHLSFHVTIMLTDDDTIRSLNMQFRGIDRATDVLSFPAADFHGLLTDHLDGGGMVEYESGLVDLGDIAICVDQASCQAAELGHSKEREIMFLALHGTLHLLGYDHESPSDEDTMTSIQRSIMNGLRGADSGS